MITYSGPHSLRDAMEAVIRKADGHSIEWVEAGEETAPDSGYVCLYEHLPNGRTYYALYRGNQRIFAAEG